MNNIFFPFSTTTSTITSSFFPRLAQLPRLCVYSVLLLSLTSLSSSSSSSSTSTTILSATSSVVSNHSSITTNTTASPSPPSSSPTSSSSSTHTTDTTPSSHPPPPLAHLINSSSPPSPAEWIPFAPINFQPHEYMSSPHPITDLQAAISPLDLDPAAEVYPVPAARFIEGVGMFPGIPPWLLGVARSLYRDSVVLDGTTVTETGAVPVGLGNTRSAISTTQLIESDRLWRMKRYEMVKPGKVSWWMTKDVNNWHKTDNYAEWRCGLLTPGSNAYRERQAWLLQTKCTISISCRVRNVLGWASKQRCSEERYHKCQKIFPDAFREFNCCSNCCSIYGDYVHLYYIMIPKYVLESIQHLAQSERDRWWIKGLNDFVRGQQYSSNTHHQGSIFEISKTVGGELFLPPSAGSGLSSTAVPTLGRQILPSIVDGFDTSLQCTCAKKGFTRIANEPKVEQFAQTAEPFCTRLNRTSDEWRFNPLNMYHPDTLTRRRRGGGVDESIMRMGIHN